MPDFSKRSEEIEIMDDLNSSGEIIEQTLRELEFINSWLGGNAVTLDAIRKVKHKLLSLDTVLIADLGCGGGDMLRLINRWAKQHSISTRLLGIDANPNIIEYAQRNVKQIGASFQAMDIFSPAFKELKFDVVLGTLFFHHFSSEQLIDFLSQLKRQVSTAIIINDIHRHPLAYHAIALLTRSFSKSSMVINDAPLSVLRAFKKSELEAIVKEAGFTHYAITWKWAFRWQLILYP